MKAIFTYQTFLQNDNGAPVPLGDVKSSNASNQNFINTSISDYLMTYVINGQIEKAVLDVGFSIAMNITENVTNDDSEDNNQTYNWFFLLLSFFVVAGGLGNVLVCLAISTERRLQNVTNYFLMSLAVADLLVSVIVMPFGILDGFFGRYISNLDEARFDMLNAVGKREFIKINGVGHWPFDWHLCNVWVTCDVLSCSCSILHMCFISLGRYLGIRNPLNQRRSSKKMVFTKIALVWLLAMFITSPITMLSMVDKTNVQATSNTCAINSQFFFVFGSLFAFYIPMIIMVSTYVLTIRLLRKKAKSLTDRGDDFRKTIRYPASHNGTLGRQIDMRDYCSYQKFLWSRDQFSRKSTRGSQYKPTGRMMRTQVMNEQKASTVLGIVFFTFVACWTPFFILNILYTVMDADSFPDYLVTTLVWLGYVSSTINPIIYTVFNKTFKRAFWKLLTCKCHNTQRVTSC